jgi:ribosomal protein S11
MTRRTSLICMALLSGVSALALSAAPAAAVPVLGFIQGAIAGLAGSAVLGGTIATAGFAAGLSAYAIIGTSVLGRLALSLGINAVAARLNRPPQPTPQDRIVNLSQPLTPMQRVYGRVRKGGAVGFTGFRNGARHYAVIIAAHRTKGPVAHWLDTTEVSVDGSGNLTTAPFTGLGSIRAYRGLAGQTVDALLDSTFAEVSSAYNFAGLSYAAIEAKRPPQADFSKVYPSGREWTYAPVWDGHDQIWDPRDSTYKWTDNAALIIAHEALFHGKTVDWAEVAIEANAADVLVGTATGGTRRRWTLNCTLDDTVPWEQARDTLGRACDAFFYETYDGRVGFRLGRYDTPTITLTDADLREVGRSDRNWGPDVPGEAVVKYTEPDLAWQQASTGAIVAEAGRARLEDDIWPVDSHNQACRLAKRMLRRARAEHTMRAQVGLIGYELIGQRFVRVQIAELAFDQVFEIDDLTLNSDGVSFTIDATSTESDDWAFNALTEEPTRPARAEVNSDDTVPDVASIAGEVVTATGGIAQIEWSWPAQSAGLSQIVRVRSLDGGMVDWQEFQAGEGQTTLLITGLTDGASYDAQVRNRTALGRVSDNWSGLVSVEAIANTVAPGALTAFSATVSGGTNANVNFTAPNDPNYAATRIWRGTTTTFSAATLVRTEYGVVGMADLWTDVGLATGTYYYWAAPINGSGIEGTLSGPSSSITII